MSNLTGKTALVTGASRGIGRAIAQRLASDGARVAIHYGSNESAARETIEAIQAAGGAAFPVRADLAVASGVDTLFDTLTAHLDGAPLDILVNNAAIMTYEATLDEATPEQFERLFAINARAPFFILQRALPVLPDGGRVVNISSGVTWFAIPQTVYAMTKGALNAMTRSAANTLGARGITVNTVSPGITDTEMNAWLHETDEASSGIAAITALDRVGRSPDIADVVAFLASDDARWVTGQTLEVNGGLYLGPRT
ncbi:SDR family oxidoreductase [Nocardia bhagyanarayanae]|uniref:NAD(P)-dependent dehydrogenase (Short-subunit alcohol dehydrogenase family) n=1 Tax=Nocardia bhagyanarayanae TaxID=1215925 RepID=A0A543FHC4_9NOCA|nr:SDR family oxidoreductase [Nocardia bhagyanarayanae]TQM33269.1 NAD(P)-dependent dehydrogenase (short-subunit alcohol dehydrogenase family) [Nocardia bhagyanarayanae]